MGTAYTIVHDGSVPIHVRNPVLTLSGNLQQSLLNRIRWQMLVSNARSIGVEIAREVFQCSPARFTCEIFWPIVLGGISFPLQQGSVVAKDRLFQLQDLLMKLRNTRLNVAEKDAARSELRSLFPRTVSLTGIDRDALHFLSYGAIQIVESVACSVPHISPDPPPFLHEGHRLGRRLFSRTRFCRRDPELQLKPWDVEFDDSF